MPTKPNENLITDPSENPRLAGILSHYSSTIAETVNFGSTVFQWILERTHEGDHHIAAFSFYRRSLDLLDSISVLIKNSCVSPCKVLLRSLFEAMLSLEYMMQSDFERRGRDYILCLKHKERDSLRQSLKGDPLHQEYIGIFRNDALLQNMRHPDIPEAEIKEAIRLKERIFTAAAYADSESSYQEVKAKRDGRNPQWWFSLHGGPRDICELAARMKRPGQYEMLYRDWAGYSHGTGGMNEHVEIRKGEIAIPQLRVPKDAEHITFMAIQYAVTITGLMVREYARDKAKELSAWYSAEIRTELFDLKKKRIIVD